MSSHEKALAEALSRMVLMHRAMLEDTEIEHSTYRAATLKEMSEAPMQALAALEAAGYRFARLNSE